MFTPRTSFMEIRFHKFFTQYSEHTLTPQYPVSSPYPDYPYLCDLCHEPSKTIIEVDGRAYHSSPEQRANDKQRQQFIEAQGYKVVRFSGKEIYHSPVSSVYKANNLINKRISNLVSLPLAHPMTPVAPS